MSSIRLAAWRQWSTFAGLTLLCAGTTLVAAEEPKAASGSEPVQISGIYPSLAAFNQNGECGIGAVVPWAGKLWFLTYPPHMRTGSDDKLYSVSPAMELTIHPESIGGTHANRLIHRESNQLLMGPYVIDADARIRTFDIKHHLVGRLTATARHLTDPANLAYYVDMEGPIFEANVRTLEVRKLFEKPLPGWHGKGAYTAQRRLVVANNGESSALRDLDKSKVTADLAAHGPEDAGVLGEWDGNTWSIVERRQFTDVTGPGGIYGNAKESDPLWAIGWDRRSVLLKLLDSGKWHTYRVPKASHCFDAKHGWFTEWPRIREVGDGHLLMVMHSTVFDFPKTFSAGNAAGLRPIATHLRYVPDFCDWNGRLVIAEDSTSIMGNPLAGQSQSNLWFGKLDDLHRWGPPQGWGGPWLGDAVKAGEPSDTYLFDGYSNRMVHLAHNVKGDVRFTFEIDPAGHGEWRGLTSVVVGATGYGWHKFDADTHGTWIRVRTDRDCGAASCYFHYLAPSAERDAKIDPLFASLAPADGMSRATSGLIRPAKHNRNLQFLAKTSEDGSSQAYYEVDETMQFTKIERDSEADTMRDIASIRPECTVDEASVIAISADGTRYRLPKGAVAFDEQGFATVRTVREVASERTLANLHGTFYEVPRSDGSTKDRLEWRRIRPVASHNLGIVDFCTWRGLLVLSGTLADAKHDGHFFSGPNAGPGLWFGAIDDLWRLGKPVGQGGPWKHTKVAAGQASDPYLMTNYDRKELALSHDGEKPVTFRIEIDYANRGTWKPYTELTVPIGETLKYAFPDGYAAHWVRLVADRPCTATAWFMYK